MKGLIKLGDIYAKYYPFWLLLWYFSAFYKEKYFGLKSQKHLKKDYGTHMRQQKITRLWLPEQLQNIDLMLAPLAPILVTILTKP